MSHFVPLDNFRASGGDNFRNTCFIAVVANLRPVLEPVMEYTQTCTWTDFVNHVRALQDHNSHTLKYGALDGNGQHDMTQRTYWEIFFMIEQVQTLLVLRSK